MDINSKVIADFISDQLSKWELADNNFKALAGVKVKTLDVDGMPIKVQFNPARIVSSSANISDRSRTSAFWSTTAWTGRAPVRQLCRC